MAGPSRQRLTVRAGGAKVALAADGVAEIVRRPRVTRMPHAPPSLLGVAHLRGRVLPVVSLAGLLGGENGAAERVVVLRREPPIGLAVEAVEALNGPGENALPDDGRLMLDIEDGVRRIDLDEVLSAQFVPRATRRGAAVRSLTQGTERAEPAKVLAFLKFMLADQAYALPLEAVSEVAPVPDEITALPQTEAVLRGVAQRRDGVLPLLSTRALLGLPEGGSAERLVVIRVGVHVLGLIVDRVDAVLRITEDRRTAAPSLFNRGAGEARIESVLRLTDGRSVVAVLSPETVLADSRVEQLLSGAGAEAAPMVHAIARERRERFLIIRLGEERYGLPVAAVDEVVRRPEALTRLPRTPDYVQGVMSLRGRLVPIIDQRRRFSSSGDTGLAARIVVVTLGALRAGFAVDAVVGILEASKQDLLPAPEMTEEGQVFDRAVEHDGEIVLLIEPQALLVGVEADLVRDFAAEASAS